uniref:Phytocyanin domain-containing protein n=1 Tax=Manihot esculenta TaxID=3983 RepID=A0A199U9V8_MANES
MARQGRFSAKQGTLMATTLLFLVLKLHFKATQAATYTVGDTSGWTFNIQSWTTGKNSRPLCLESFLGTVFNYDPSLHNVAIVDINGYNSCSASPRSITYSSGKDSVKWNKGENYYICSIPGHCDGGLKIAITAFYIENYSKYCIFMGS